MFRGVVMNENQMNLMYKANDWFGARDNCPQCGYCRHCGRSNAPQGLQPTVTWTTASGGTLQNG
jgi:hypothetical protein